MGQFFEPSASKRCFAYRKQALEFVVGSRKAAIPVELKNRIGVESEKRMVALLFYRGAMGRVRSTVRAVL